MRNARHALTIAAVTASFAAALPASTIAQTYYYPRGDHQTYRSDAERYSPAPAYTPADPTYNSTNSTYSYPAAASVRGVVESVEVIAERGHGSGAGAVIGGVAGGLLGSQLGSGSGNAVATIGGALGGAYLGNEVERRRRADETLRFNVRMDDGTLRTFTQDSPEIRVGSRVRMTDEGQIVLS